MPKAPKSATKQIVNFLFEVGILSKTPRSGFHFLGSGQQSVAEHTSRTIFIGYVLALSSQDVDLGKVLQMCLFHDLVEGRTSDLNYVHQKYTLADEYKAARDLAESFPFGSHMMEVLTEYGKRESHEAILAKEADILEWILSLKEQVDIGNKRAETWLPSAVKRLKTDVAKGLAQEILSTRSDEWWFGNREDKWWVSRNKKVTKKRI